MRHLGTLTLLASLAAGCDRSSESQPEKTSTPSTRTAPSRSAPPPEPAKPPAPKGPKEPLNVLLLTIDSLRHDMPWTGGYDRKIAPNLTRLAKQSVVYTHAYAFSSYTAKSVGGMLGGRPPASLYRSGWFFAGYSDANLFFPEVLQKQGIRTIAGHAHMYFARGKNLDQGFDVWELTPGISFDPQTDNHVTSHKMTDLAMALLGKPENAAKTFFAWFHYMDPHDQYIQHEESPEWGRTGRDKYDSEVFYTDLHIGRLLDWAQEQPWWDKTAVIVSADHGEAFGEHDFYKHAFWLWDVIARVPLVVRIPGVEHREIHQRRSHIDLAPTILELQKVADIPDAFLGTSLVPEMYGATEPAERKQIVVELPEDSHNPPITAVLSGDYKILRYGTHKWELFNIEKDPGETKELSATEPEALERMQKVYEAALASPERVKPFGGMKLRGGGTANGPTGPAKTE